MNIVPYGVAITQAIASGEVAKMQAAQQAAEQHLNQYGDVRTALAVLKVEIAKLEASR